MLNCRQEGKLCLDVRLLMGLPLPSIVAESLVITIDGRRTARNGLMIMVSDDRADTGKKLLQAMLCTG